MKVLVDLVGGTVDNLDTGETLLNCQGLELMELMREVLTPSQLDRLTSYEGSVFTLSNKKATVLSKLKTNNSR